MYLNTININKAKLVYEVASEVGTKEILAARK